MEITYRFTLHPGYGPFILIGYGLVEVHEVLDHLLFHFRKVTLESGTPWGSEYVAMTRDGDTLTIQE